MIISETVRDRAKQTKIWDDMDANGLDDQILNIFLNLKNIAYLKNVRDVTLRGHLTSCNTPGAKICSILL